MKRKIWKKGKKELNLNTKEKRNGEGKEGRKQDSGGGKEREKENELKKGIKKKIENGRRKRR